MNQVTAKPQIEVAMQYAVVIERAATSFGAYVPDLPGCVAVGESKAEVRNSFEKLSPFK